MPNFVVRAGERKEIRGTLYDHLVIEAGGTAVAIGDVRLAGGVTVNGTLEIIGNRGLNS